LTPDSWATVMRAVADHGTRLVEDPGRPDGVATLGLDETNFLKATRTASTRYVTGLVDLEQGRLPGCGGRPHQGRGRPLAWCSAP
jgi:hypothetical protein